MFWKLQCDYEKDETHRQLLPVSADQSTPELRMEYPCMGAAWTAPVARYIHLVVPWRYGTVDRRYPRRHVGHVLGQQMWQHTGSTQNKQKPLFRKKSKIRK